MKKKTQKPPSIRTLQKQIKTLENDRNYWLTKCAAAEKRSETLSAHLEVERKVSQVLYEKNENITNDFNLLKKQGEDFAATIRVLSGIENIENIGTVATAFFECGIVSLENLRRYHSNKERPTVL